jgi:hypothetical protein
VPNELRRRFRAWVERELPWYDNEAEDQRLAKSRWLEKQTELTKTRVEAVIRDYDAASNSQGQAAKALIREARRK